MIEQRIEPDGEVAALKAEIERLRALLSEARDYVQECCDRETKRHSKENDQRLLAAIDKAISRD